MLTHPSVHLNGTSREELVRLHQNAWGAVNNAIDALREAAPNGRDFYVQADKDAYTNAAREHNERLKKLDAVRIELEEIMEGLAS